MLEVAIKINRMLERDMFYRKNKNLNKRGLEDRRAWFAILNRMIMVCLLKDVFLILRSTQSEGNLMLFFTLKYC